MQDNLCPNCFQPMDPNAKFCSNCGFSGRSNQEKYPVALPAGTVLAGRYIVGRVLGQGGFGITYLALDYQTKEKVALKEYFPETMVTRSQSLTVSSYAGDREENFNYGKDCFLDEAKTLAEFIGNENIVRVYSYFEEYGTAYFAMEFIEGESLQDYITRKGGRISFDDAKRILFPVMDALAAVHAKGIIHRDISPDNIYICKDNTVKLLDFGAARYSLGDKSRSLDVVLKHGYAPKEQYTRRGRQGPYTDVYSIAATFYRAITGQIPPDSIDRIDNDELKTPSALGVNIPKKAEEALLKALSVQPEKRFQNVAALKNAMTIGSASPTGNMTTDKAGITFFNPTTTPSSNTAASNPRSGSGPAPGIPNSQNTYAPPSGVPNSQNTYAPTSGAQNSQNTYAPTSGYNQTAGYRPAANQTVANNTTGYPSTTGANRTVGANPTVAGQTPSAPPKKSKKWLIPVIIGGSLTLVLLLILIPVLTCVGNAKKAIDSLPTYVPSTVSSSTTAPGSTTANLTGEWNVDIYAANTDKNDEDTLITTVGTDADYFHIDFYVYDGDKDHPITISYNFSKDGETSSKSQWDSVVPDDTLTIYWEDGFDTETLGKVTVTLFNETAGGTKLCDFTFEIVEGATPSGGSSATTSGGSSTGTGNIYTDKTGATLHVGDTWKIDGQFSITVNSIEETSLRDETSNKTNPPVVYIIDFTYTNYGHNGASVDGLYFGFSLDTKDAAGNDTDLYYLPEAVYPTFIPIGETLHCIQPISASKAGTVTSTQVQYVGDERCEATFILEP